MGHLGHCFVSLKVHVNKSLLQPSNHPSSFSSSVFHRGQKRCAPVLPFRGTVRCGVRVTGAPLVGKSWVGKNNKISEGL